MSDFNFRIWIYLITYVDDYGCGSADPELLKGIVFPRRKGLTEQQIGKALEDLATAGMIKLYEVDGESYLYFPNWANHQQMRAKKRKFPAPDMVNKEKKPSDSNGNHMKSSDSTCSRNPIQSNTESESESRRETRAREDPPPEMTAVQYCEMVLRGMSPGNFEELRSFLGEDGLPDDLVKYAVDDACGHGYRAWSYVAKILNRYVVSGIRTVEQAAAEKKAHDSAAGTKRAEAENPMPAENWGGDL